MSRRIVTDDAAVDTDQWERFVFDHPLGNVFQTPRMLAAYAATRNYRPLVVACYDGESLSGILLALIQKEYRGILGSLSARSIVWGGPLIKDNNSEILNLIMDAYDRIVAPLAVYSQIRNIGEMEWAKSHLAAMGYRYEDHLNIVVDLKKSEEDLWRAVHANRRNKINRAGKNGLKFSLLNDERSIMQTYSVLKVLYSRNRMPLPDISLFMNLFAMDKKESPLRLFATFHENEIAGILVALCYRERIYEWYVGGEERFFDKYPNDLIPWEVFLWGKAHGYGLFDFGGAGKPDVPYGVRDFKLKFGGELVNLGRFQKIHKPSVMRIAKRGFGFWRLLKKRK
jgi:serine/alanine adding enzyme